MSFDDLKQMMDNTYVEPPVITEPSSVEELVLTRDDVTAISAQRDMENRFNVADSQSFDVHSRLSALSDPADISQVGGETGSAKNIALFTVGYSSRIIRSVLAISNLTASAERFGDIRNSQGLWVAMVDLAVMSKDRMVGLTERTTELKKKIPGLLTDPEVPETDIPSVGRLVTGPIPELEYAEWVFDLIGELVIEANVAKGTKKLAQKGMTKLTKGAYEAGEGIVKKKGISRLLGELDDDEIRAVDDAVKYRKVGKLGTKPPAEDIDDAVRRTLGYIDESKPSRLTKKEMISAKRKQGAARMYATRGDNYGQGYSARLRTAGATKATEKSYKPLIEASADAASDEVILQKVIDNYDFGQSKIYTTANTQETLAKLYEYGELLTPGEVEGLRDVFGRNFADSLGKVTSKPTGLAGKLFDVGSKGIQGLNHTSRTLMTTGELSYLLRQANFRAWSRPMDAISSFAVATRSLISPKYADYLDDAIRFSKSGKVGTEHGLFLGKWRDIKRLLEREEVFMAEWLDKVPVIGKIKIGFERGYVNGLNKVRLDWFDEGLQLLEQAGKAGDEGLVRKWASYVNNMTGRADIDNIAEANKVLKGMAETAKDVLFAPRFTASKWNRHKVAAEIMFGADTPNAMRGLLATDAVKKWRRYERFAHYATQNGAKVETDPRSSDLLKLVVGDTHYDVLGGDAQLLVLLARLASGQTKDTATGLLKDNIASEIAQQYISGKLNPMWSLVIDKSFGRTFTGEDIDDPKVLAKVIRDKFIPLYLNDIKDKIFNDYEEQGKTIAESLESALPVAFIGFGGAGIQTYSPSARKEYELMVNDKAVEIYAKNFDELPVYQKQEVLWEAENDDIDKTELLKEEMGMNRQTRSASARLTKMRNKSFRAIRKGLGKDYKLFKESHIPVREFSIDLGEIRLSTKQHEKLSGLYVKFIKEELSRYPDIARLPPADYERRRWLEDIESNAREDAVAELEFAE